MTLSQLSYPFIEILKRNEHESNTWPFKSWRFINTVIPTNIINENS